MYGRDSGKRISAGFYSKLFTAKDHPEDYKATKNPSLAIESNAAFTLRYRRTKLRSTLGLTYLVLFTPKITMYLHIGVQKVHKNLMLFEKASTEQNLSRILRLKCEELAYKSTWL